jgi:uncharacterized protein (DUF1778 family)
MTDADDRYQRINLRIPRALHARLMEAAEARSTSMNQEIIERLAQSWYTLSREEMLIDQEKTLTARMNLEYAIREATDVLARTASLQETISNKLAELVEFEKKLYEGKT